MSDISLRNITKRFGTTTAVDRLSLTILPMASLSCC